MKTRAALGALAMAAAVFVEPAAGAKAAPALDVKIELRVLDFIAAPSDRNQVAVLYDGQSRQSAEEAAEILQALRDSSGLARNGFTPRMLEVHALSRIKALKAVILTRGMEASYDEVFHYGISSQTLVLSSGTDCVRNHHCMVGVSSLPEIEIGVNEQAVQDGGIRFLDGFQLMVKPY